MSLGMLSLPKVAELYFFYSEVNLALLNYENAYEVL